MSSLLEQQLIQNNQQLIQNNQRFERFAKILDDIQIKFDKLNENKIQQIFSNEREEKIAKLTIELKNEKIVYKAELELEYNTQTDLICSIRSKMFNNKDENSKQEYLKQTKILDLLRDKIEKNK